MGNTHIKTIVSYVLLSSIFILGDDIVLPGFTLRWYHFLYMIFFVWGIVYYRKISIKLVLVFFFILVYSLITHQYGLSLVVKQMVNTVFSCFVFYFFLVVEEFNFESVFKKYIHVAQVVLLLGFFQVVLFLVGEGPIFISVFYFLQDTNITARFQSVSDEPSYIAFTFAPVVFLSLQNLVLRTPYLISKTWSFFFIVGYFLTLSLVAYIGLVLMVMFLTFKNYSLRKLIIAIFVFFGIAMFSWFSYTSIPLITVRVNDTVKGISMDSTQYDSLRKLNYSSFTFLSNLYVTRESMKDHPLVGTGLGTYELTYEKLLPEELKFHAELNKRDAGSMGFRLLTETGLIGFALFCLFLARYKLNLTHDYSPDQDLYWVLNSGIFVMLVLELIRDGNYTHHGKFLFILLYYYTCVFVRSELKSSVNEPVEAAS